MSAKTRKPDKDTRQLGFWKVPEAGIILSSFPRRRESRTIFRMRKCNRLERLDWAPACPEHSEGPPQG